METYDDGDSAHLTMEAMTIEKMTIAKDHAVQLTHAGGDNDDIGGGLMFILFLPWPSQNTIYFYKYYNMLQELSR